MDLEKRLERLVGGQVAAHIKDLWDGAGLVEDWGNVPRHMVAEAGVGFVLSSILVWKQPHIELDVRCVVVHGLLHDIGMKRWVTRDSIGPHGEKLPQTAELNHARSGAVVLKELGFRDPRVLASVAAHGDVDWPPHLGSWESVLRQWLIDPLLGVRMWLCFYADQRVKGEKVVPLSVRMEMDYGPNEQEATRARVESCARAFEGWFRQQVGRDPDAVLEGLVF